MKLAEFVRKDVDAVKSQSPLRTQGFEFKMEPADVPEKTRDLCISPFS